MHNQIRNTEFKYVQIDNAQRMWYNPGYNKRELPSWQRAILQNNPYRQKRQHPPGFVILTGT